MSVPLSEKDPIKRGLIVERGKREGDYCKISISIWVRWGDPGIKTLADILDVFRWRLGKEKIETKAYGRWIGKKENSQTSTFDRWANGNQFGSFNSDDD